jgi:Domain of unknown function (DUF6379)
MLEQSMIQTKGFRNSEQGGEPAGFEVRIRSPYYRGTWTNLIDGVRVEVDGEAFRHEEIVWSISGSDYTADELRESDTARWPLTETATLRVPKPGGLSVGIHDVTVALSFRMSYIPVELQPQTWTATRKATIVR